FQKAKQDSTPTTASSSSWNYVFDTDLSFKGQQDTVDFIASRSQYPFANGTETLLTAFEVTEKHALNKNLLVNAAANYEFAKQPESITGVNLDREYGGRLGLTYHLTDHWDADTSYSYKNETLTGVSGDIDNNAILIGITYHPFI